MRPDLIYEETLAGVDHLNLHTKYDETISFVQSIFNEYMTGEDPVFDQANWQQLVDALEAAKAVMADGDALQNDVDEAADALLDAILAQRFKADKSILKELVNQAEAMDLSGYTAQSVATFRTALQNAQAVMADNSLTEDDQAKVDAAVARKRRG